MLWIDTETYNGEKDIKVGTYEYARTCEIMLITYSIDDGPEKLWDRTKDPMPDDLAKAFDDPGTKYCAHHAAFDRAVLRYSGLVKPHVWDPKNWVCTMVMAMLHGFPGSLDALCKVFKLSADQAKQKDGKRLVLKFCKPAPKNRKVDRYTAENSPIDWLRFGQYAVWDIKAMKAIAARLPKWNWVEGEYHLDQVINDRGFLVDTDLVHAGAVAAVEEKISLAERFREIIKGDVDRPTQRAKFMAYLNDNFGLGLENTQKVTFEALMKDPFLDETARELMQISIDMNKTSTAKYAALEPAVSPDNRFRGGLQFSGATRTRRWSGKNFQPQNLPSKGIPEPESIEIYIEALKEGIHADLYPGELMKYGSGALRGVLIAPEGKKLCVSDLSNIEGRANAWLAGEDWKLKAFEEYDTFKRDEKGCAVSDGKGDFLRLGPDLYKVAAGKILGKPPEAVTKEERNSFGKVTELALGYQGGVGAIQKFAESLGVNFYEHWDAIQSSVDKNIIIRAQFNWGKWGHKKAGELSQEEWLASEVVKISWRSNHPKIEKLWHACENAAIAALQTPGSTHRAGRYLTFKYVRNNGMNYLLMRLPSGNCLVYFGAKYTPKIPEIANPHLADVRAALDLIEKHKGYPEVIHVLEAYGACIHISDLDKQYYEQVISACAEIVRGVGIGFWGVDSTTKQWARQHIYGGKFIENAAQSLSRDILMSGAKGAEGAGYEIVLTVHDELVTECSDTDEFSHEQLSEILATPIDWAPGFPLAAAGFEAYRYRK